jgi:hypothetical protein
MTLGDTSDAEGVHHAFILLKKIQYYRPMIQGPITKSRRFRMCCGVCYEVVCNSLLFCNSGPTIVIHKI